MKRKKLYIAILLLAGVLTSCKVGKSYVRPDLHLPDSLERVVSRDLSVDIGGTWVSYGIGAQFNTTKNLNFYGTLERANGSEYQEDYRYSVGMSYRF